MFKFTRTPKTPYGQEMIAEHIGHMVELYKQRDKSIQLSVVTKGKDKQRYADEVERTSGNIESAQKVLAFMLDEIQSHHERQSSRKRNY